MKSLRMLFTAFSVLILSSLVAAAPAGSPHTLMTEFSLFVGLAENGDAHDGLTLILPGTVLPSMVGDEWSQDMGKLKTQLKKAYRLKKMLTTAQYSKRMGKGTLATEQVRETRVEKLLDCIQIQALGKEVPQSFSR